MAELICECRKRFAGGFALDAALRLPLDRASVTVLFGASGSGKTTLLRLLAGLDRPDAGTIHFGDQVWHDSSRGIHVPPERRRAGFLFQDYALFRHLTVSGNVAFGATGENALRMLAAFGLGEFAARYPRELSGGQQQRVALARALAAGPSLLLLDEPLSALDAGTRTRTRSELRRILRQSGVPSVVVTHDRMEAVALGDWMAVIAGGRIQQTGAVQEVFRRPVNSAVAESVGVENILPARIVSRHNGLLTVAVGAAQLDCVDSGESGAVLACIRAEDVVLTREAQTSSARNRVAGTIREVTAEGALARVELDCGFPLVALVTAQSAAELGLAVGDPISAIVKTTSVHLAAAIS
jgi:molybdate transport system ATP-binding protein